MTTVTKQERIKSLTILANTYAYAGNYETYEKLMKRVEELKNE